MLLNNFKIAIRNLGKNKMFSLINIAGLALGLAVFMLIMLWVNNEMGYNDFHEGKEDIAMVMVNKSSSGNISTFPAVPSKLAGALKNDLAGIEYTARCTWGDIRLFDYGGKSFSEKGFYVDPEFLNIFSFKLTKGSEERVLREPRTVLISETLASKYFKDENPVGQSIMVEQNKAYKIDGVFRDVPGNSTIKFDFLMPVNDYIEENMGGKENWTNNNIRTYVKLKNGTNRVQLDAKIKEFMQQYTQDQQNASLFLFDLKDWYLRNDFKNGMYAGGGRITYVKMFIIIAVFILLLACINFMNLSTARATQRAKEVGIRKTIGAGKKSLIRQFISESVLFSAISGVIALAIVIAVLPAFNNALNKNISIDFTNGLNAVLFAGIIILTGLLAGSYPAWVLSSFKPVKVLKSVSDNVSGSTVWVRKALVVVQFAVSVMLITGTIVVYRQMHFIKNKNLGYNKENLIWFSNHIAAEKNEIAISEFNKVPGVTNVARATSSFTNSNNRGDGVKWPGKQPGQEIFFSFITGDHNIVQTMGIEMKEGRAFSKDYAMDTAAFIVNEEAVKRMGLKDPVGQVIETYSGKGTIIGVARNFHIESLHSPVAPIIMECKPEWTWLYFVRIDGKHMQQTLSSLESVYKTMAPGYLFDYSFQDSDYENLYRSEQQTGMLVNWFAFFAIFISCLGLLGLTMFTIQRKTKEIGIRKVLGAPVSSIVILISRQFLSLVILSILIAIAPVWYFMHDWLQGYSYRIEMNWWICAIAGGLALLVALATISVQAINAALSNPVKSLRTE